jgi:hypothetical protein
MSARVVSPGLWVQKYASADAFENGAAFSLDDAETYRYGLWRRLRDPHDAGKRIGFLMLNPSTADAQQDDPTIRRCIGYARAWGAELLEIANLFALRATDPRELYRHADPVGPANAQWLQDFSMRCAFIVCAWGVHGDHLRRGRAVAKELASYGADLRALRLTKGGSPAHPLYLPASLKPFKWGPA